MTSWSRTIPIEKQAVINKYRNAQSLKGKAMSTEERKRRLERIVEMRAQGDYLATIAAEFSISATRVRDLLAFHETMPMIRRYTGKIREAINAGEDIKTVAARFYIRPWRVKQLLEEFPDDQAD